MWSLTIESVLCHSRQLRAPTKQQLRIIGALRVRQPWFRNMVDISGEMLVCVFLKKMGNDHVLSHSHLRFCPSSKTPAFQLYLIS